jgi:hypothetical protein
MLVQTENKIKNFKSLTASQKGKQIIAGLKINLYFYWR